MGASGHRIVTRCKSSPVKMSVIIWFLMTYIYDIYDINDIHMSECPFKILTYLPANNKLQEQPAVKTRRDKIVKIQITYLNFNDIHMA